jgi:branched-chain amino acid aminotransferase
MVKKEQLLTPHADACLTGITRGNVLRIADELNIAIVEKNISISEFYNADEVFTTGTMGELTPVYEIDGRVIENKSESNLRKQIYEAYKTLTQYEGESIE